MDDVGVPQYFQDADLTRDPLDVCLFDYLLFLESLNGHFLTGGDVDAEPHLAESALSDGFA